MNERQFVLNFDHISEGRTEDHPGRGQLIVKGKVLTHTKGGSDDPVKTCLVLAIEKSYLADFARYVDPEFDGNVLVKAYARLTDFDSSVTLDPEDIYAAIVVEDGGIQ